MRITVAFLCLGIMLSGGVAQAAPQRVVSLNPCLDATLVALADRDQIAAVIHYARDPYASSIPEIAATLPITYETAEEIIALSPDLVLVSGHSSAPTRNALRRLGISVEFFEVPNTVVGSLAQIRRMAALTGHKDRGEELVVRIEAAFAAAQPPPDATPITALLVQPGGFGARTLSEDVMRRTGFTNIAARYGIGLAGNVPLELLIADPPGVVLAGEVDPAMPGWAERVLRHPALRHAGDRIPRVTYPQRLMYCGGPVLIEAAATLKAAHVKLGGATP